MKTFAQKFVIEHLFKQIDFRNYAILVLIMLFCVVRISAQTYNQIDEFGEITEHNEETSNNFNKHNNDTTRAKEIPKGIYVWTVDRTFGDIRPDVPDTIPHLYMNSNFNTGVHGEYNNTGNNYTARINRIVIDRPETSQFVFTQPYSHTLTEPDGFHFTNTLSPLTNISYETCGDKTDGEDHIQAKFAVNAGKRIGLGFDINYAYARGYYSNQNVSHFGATLYGSYLGDHYNLHFMWNTYDRKVSENGGITDDNYISHPESFGEEFIESEIPVVLSSNFNRNHSNNYFLTHRYNVGFYRMEQMTEEEIKAREFALASKKEHEEKEIKEERTESVVSGRPDDAPIMGDEPEITDSLLVDTSRISVASVEEMDSLLAEQAYQDSINATMKRVFVPVTSFIHTLDYSTNRHIYLSYVTPESYYTNTFFNYYDGRIYGGDSIKDETWQTSLKNTLAVALLEGFNKWVKAGLKLFAQHEVRKFEMPEIIDTDYGKAAGRSAYTENTVSIGGLLSKTQGNVLHFNAMLQAWVMGEDAGQLKVDGGIDLNFRLFGDTVTLGAKGYFHRTNPIFLQRHYHSKHLWWDNDLDFETRTRLEGLLTFRKTNTRIRVAIEEIQNYTFYAMSYDATTSSRTNLTASVNQSNANINLMTVQLMQDVHIGIFNWENIITYQNCNHQENLPVPALNIFTNLYLKFRIAKVLLVELGGDCYFFTEYYAPDYIPLIGQFAVQTNNSSKVKIGNYPFIDVYANMHLKRARFFIMYSHVNEGMGNHLYFLTPHYPQNARTLRFGVSWNFFN